jgi:hypothetical protein
MNKRTIQVCSCSSWESVCFIIGFIKILRYLFFRACKHLLSERGDIPILGYNNLPIKWRILVNNLDKNLSGKSGERDVKLCKTWFFILYSSFFILRKLSFRTAKHKLWPPQRSCFIASNISFRTTKRYLWRSETIPLANLYFVNREITDLNPCNKLSVNALRKTSKNAFFSTEEPFLHKDAILEGVKFEFSLTKVVLTHLQNFWQHLKGLNCLFFYIFATILNDK